MHRVRNALLSIAGATLVLAAAPGIALASPTIESESASHVTPTDATLEAHINTEGLEHGDHYQFQLVTNTSEYAAEFTCPTEGFPHGSSLCLGIAEQPGALPISFLEGGLTGRLVTLDLASASRALSPNTTYHYRVITARSIPTEDTIRWEAPIVYGPDQTFTTGPVQTSTTPKRWFINGKLAEAKHEPTFSYGKVEFKNAVLKTITCQNFLAGSSWNEVKEGTERGFQNTIGYSTWECKATLPC